MKLANVHSARVSVFLKYTMFNCLCFYITYDSPLVENKIWFHWNQTHLCCVLQSEVQGSPVCRGFCVQSCSPSRSKVSHTFTFNKSLLVLLLPRVTMHCLDFVCVAFRLPTNVLKPEDWDRRDNQPWRPQLGFNSNRQRSHLDQSGFRALG